MLSGKLFLCALILFLCSCNSMQPVEYRGLSNFNVGLKPKPVASADIRFFNPNKVSGKLTSAEMEIWVDGKKAGSVVQTYDIPVKKQSEFSVPVEVGISLKELGVLNTMATLLRGDPLPVMLKGHVQVQVHGIPIRIPVEHTEKIKVGK